MTGEIEKPKPKNKGSNKAPDWKTKSILVLFLVLVATLGLAWFYFRKTQPKIKQAKAVLQTVEKLNQEKQRCSRLINQESGDFAEYEYCNRFLEKFPL